MRRLSLLGIILLCIGAGIYGFRMRKDNTNAVHYHAGFVVYIDGVKQDFSDMKYMNFTACSEHEKKKSAAEEQLEKAHLHDGVGDVVHVHRSGGTWEDLFKNSKYTIPSDKNITLFRNGQEAGNTLSHPIVPDESIIIVIGTREGVDTSSYVPLSRIKEVEAKSELCGS